MKKLRQILTRSGKGSKTVETDLRGLGEDALFKHSHPVAVLTATGLTEEARRAIDAHPHWERHSAKPGQPEHLVSRTPHAGLHKEHAVRFFFASQELASHPALESAKLHLWEVNPLKHLMEQGARGKVVANPLPTAIDAEYRARAPKKQSSWLQVSGATLHHLHQAGFKGVQASRETQGFEREELTKILATEKAATAPQRKRETG